jgi:hypothetical protein
LLTLEGTQTRPSIPAKAMSYGLGISLVGATMSQSSGVDTEHKIDTEAEAEEERCHLFGKPSRIKS